MKIHIYTDEEISFLKENIKGRKQVELAEMFNERFGLNLGFGQIRGAIHNRHLTNELNYKFKKGQISHNKGKKGTGGWEPTQFKKGNVPANYKPVGSERIDVDGYVWVKTSDPNKWRMKHVVVWEKKNGEVPKGCVVLFSDGNKQNVTPDNLLLVSRRQLAILNHHGLLQKDKLINETALLTVDLILKIGDIKRSRKL
jgi:hypothetical protein